jgi:hypothetical protein
MSSGGHACQTTLQRLDLHHWAPTHLLALLAAVDWCLGGGPLALLLLPCLLLVLLVLASANFSVLVGGSIVVGLH